MRRILLVGGAGFIGSHLVQRLADTHQIVVLDALYRNAMAFTSLGHHPNVEMRTGDVLDPAQVASASAGVNAIIHLAAVAGIDSVTRRPTRTMNINVLGTYNVCEAAARTRTLERLIFFSTSEVYGPHCNRPSEDAPTPVGAATEPRWIYAASKVAGEHMVLGYHKEFGVPATVVRPFNCYGERQVGEGAIQLFVSKAVRDEPLEIRGGGQQVRAWLHVQDMVDAIERILKTPAAVGEIFNLGNPETAVTTRELAGTVLKVCRSQSVLREVPAPGVDVEYRVPSIEKAHRLLDWAPRVGLEEGIARTAQFFRETAA